MIRFDHGWEPSDACPRIAKWALVSLGTSTSFVGLSINYIRPKVWPELVFKGRGPETYYQIVMPGYGNPLPGPLWVGKGKWIKVYRFDTNALERWRREVYA